MATGTVNSHGTPLNKRSGPGTNYPVVGSVADGTTVTIACQTNGTSVNGNWGSTSLWDRLADNTYVSDGFVDTGTNNMVAPACGGTPGQPGGTIQQRLDRFISDWEGKYLNYHDSVPNQCVSVANAWSEEYLGLHVFNVATAVQIIGQGGSDYTRVDKTPTNFPPPGAIVVFHEDAAPAEGITSAGHVDVSISANQNSFVGFDQNWGSPNYCRQVTHDYSAVIGWLIANRVA